MYMRYTDELSKYEIFNTKILNAKFYTAKISQSMVYSLKQLNVFCTKFWWINYSLDVLRVLLMHKLLFEWFKGLALFFPSIGVS